VASCGFFARVFLFYCMLSDLVGGWMGGGLDLVGGTVDSVGGKHS
jgi:hypothetical protein